MVAVLLPACQSSLNECAAFVLMAQPLSSRSRRHPEKSKGHRYAARAAAPASAAAAAAQVFGCLLAFEVHGNVHANAFESAHSESEPPRGAEPHSRSPPSS